MTGEPTTENLIAAKLALADKYERLARTCHSRPRQAVLRRRAGHYRRQAESASRQLALSGHE
jgi:hypothetical protein